MASLDVSLDDMIKNSKKNKKIEQAQGVSRRGRGRGGSSNARRRFGAPYRNPLGVNARSSSNAIGKSFSRIKKLTWQNGLLEDSLKAAGLPRLEAGTKLHIGNLDAGVSNEDIRELFSEIGELIRYAVHFDKHGRPNGSAEVVFARRSDAFQAFRRYNNVQLDGKPMKVEIAGSNMEIPAPARVNVARATRGKKRTVSMGTGRFRSRGGGTTVTMSDTGLRGQGNGQRRGGGGRRRGGARGKKQMEKSADQLDKELDSYHAEAMQS